MDMIQKQDKRQMSVQTFNFTKTSSIKKPRQVRSSVRTINMNGTVHKKFVPSGQTVNQVDQVDQGFETTA